MTTINKIYTFFLSVEWISRDENVEADDMSRFDDPNDYMLDPFCFRYINEA